MAPQRTFLLLLLLLLLLIQCAHDSDLPSKTVLSQAPIRPEVNYNSNGATRRSTRVWVWLFCLLASRPEWDKISGVLLMFFKKSSAVQVNSPALGPSRVPLI